MVEVLFNHNLSSRSSKLSIVDKSVDNKSQIYRFRYDKYIFIVLHERCLNISSWVMCQIEGQP